MDACLQADETLIRMEINHSETEGEGRFFIGIEGQFVAEMTYRKPQAGVIVIDHTEVLESLKGRGIAKKMVFYAVEVARAEGLRILPECRFAAAMFRRHPEWNDVLLKD